MTEPLKKFTINRAKWYRGRGYQGSCLLNEVGMMCCMGMWALFIGCDPKDIKGVTTIDTIQKVSKEINNVLNEFRILQKSSDPSCFPRSIYELNDRPEINDLEREKELTRRFLANGYEVEFVG